MERRTFLKTMALALPALYSGQLFAAASSNVASIIKALGINLSTSGRVSFYVDYSERSTTGDHTFYVCRTHGTSGQISVDFITTGDVHSVASGTITWADGDAAIKSFNVNVASKANGDHRICAQLVNPTGGAILHNGNYTKAYGIIDDGTIASDAEAIFYDAQASVNGIGTQSSPFNNIYDAIANIGNERYLYGKGTTVPNATNRVNPNGGGGIADCIFIPTSRSGESDRLSIRNWPGSKWTITGGSASNKIGFYSDGPGGKVGDSSYITFRGIDFVNLNCSGVTYCEGGGIGYFKKECAAITIEICVFDNINGSTNTSGFNAYSVNGAKVWRCTANNIKVNGDNSNGNAGGLSLYYGATNLSFQRCEITNSGVGFYFKFSRPAGILLNVSFCKVKCRVGIKYGFGSSSYETSYSIVRGNLFKNATTYYALEFTGASPVGGKNWIVGNVFDNCGGGDNGAIYSTSSYDLQIFNNIFYNCRKMWDTPDSVGRQSNSGANQIEYADYNHDYGTTAERYRYLGVKYSSASSLVSTGLAMNDTSGNPLFNNPATDDYTLKSGSPCIQNGLSGNNQGIYVTGIEKLGAGGIMAQVKRSSAPTSLSVI